MLSVGLLRDSGPLFHFGSTQAGQDLPRRCCGPGSSVLCGGLWPVPSLATYLWHIQDGSCSSSSTTATHNGFLLTRTLLSTAHSSAPGFQLPPLCCSSLPHIPSKNTSFPSLIDPPWPPRLRTVFRQRHRNQASNQQPATASHPPNTDQKHPTRAAHHRLAPDAPR